MAQTGSEKWLTEYQPKIDALKKWFKANNLDGPDQLNTMGWMIGTLIGVHVFEKVQSAAERGDKLEGGLSVMAGLMSMAALKAIKTKSEN
jgi:hypothetical protein